MTNIQISISESAKKNNLNGLKFHALNFGYYLLFDSCYLKFPLINFFISFTNS